MMVYIVLRYRRGHDISGSDKSCQEGRQTYVQGGPVGGWIWGGGRTGRAGGSQDISLGPNVRGNAEQPPLGGQPAAGR